MKLTLAGPTYETLLTGHDTSPNGVRCSTQTGRFWFEWWRGSTLCWRFYLVDGKDQDRALACVFADHNLSAPPDSRNRPVTPSVTPLVAVSYI